MRTLEVRRHSLREHPNEHLSAEGIALARRVGAEMGPFTLVVTTPLTRAVETAVVMGFAIDETLQYGDSSEAEASYEVCGYPISFAQMRDSVRRENVCASFAASQARVWRDIVAKIEDGERALLISHGFSIEIGAVGTLPEAPYADWGGPVGCCEGVRLYFEGETCTGGEVLRLSSA